MSDLNRIRTDVVGSLLRPPAWKEARTRFDAGTMGNDEFQRLEERCIRDFVRLQESIGLDVGTDGEISRLNFQDSFGLSVTGYDACRERAKQHEKRSEGASALRRWDIPDLTEPGTAASHRRTTGRCL